MIPKNQTCSENGKIGGIKRWEGRSKQERVNGMIPAIQKRWTPKSRDELESNNLDGERWRAIHGWEEYEVSDKCRVRSVRGPIKLFISNGYYSFNVVAEGGRRKMLKLHREMVKAFNPGYGRCIRHLDGNPLNCALNNLEWGSFKDNEEDKKRHGRSLAGERNPSARLSEMDVISIRKSTLSSLDLALIYGVGPGAIRDIKNRKTWKSVR